MLKLASASKIESFITLLMAFYATWTEEPQKNETKAFTDTLYATTRIITNAVLFDALNIAAAIFSKIIPCF